MTTEPAPLPAAPTASLLIVDDDVIVIQVLSKALAGVGRLRYATSGADALRLAKSEQPDIVLLDAEMPDLSGFDVLAAMHRDPVLRDIPVVFITSHSDAAMEEHGLSLGAADFIAKPIRPAIVAARVRTQLRLKQATDRLRRLASIDGLTGVANRRTLDESLDVECRRALRNRQPLTVLMVDVDHFKRYNDTYGHGPGDAVLQAVAQAMQQSTSRPADLVARYGGEEFAVLLPDTDGAGGESVAAAVAQRIQALQIPHSASPLGQLSVSIGIASFDEHCALWSDSESDPSERREGPRLMCAQSLLTTADQALYAAKQQGRARHVRLAMSPPPDGAVRAA